MLFKFQVNQIKIEHLKNLAYVDLLVNVDLKINLTSGSGFGASTGLLRGSLLTISKLSFRSLSVPF